MKIFCLADSAAFRRRMRPFGGVPQMFSSEETALVNFKPGGGMDGAR